jgi:putative ABC transport system permease protein
LLPLGGQRSCDGRKRGGTPMNVLRLAYAYARRRPLATLLNVALLAVGVATITLVILLTGELDARMRREAAGIDLVVGAKGSPLQLVLAGVYHADVPPGNIPLAAIAMLRTNPLIAEVIPLALGDSHRGFRIVGTEPAFVAHYGASLADGALWTAPMEVVLGSEVARASGLAVGGTFTGSHGLAEGGAEHSDALYRVVGVLAPTRTVIDRLVVTGIDSVWRVHEHHDDDDEDGKAGLDHDEHAKSKTGKADAVAKPEPGREVTLLLVKYTSPVAAATVPRAINAATALQSASPAYETARLLTVFGVGTDVIRGFALLLIAASALGLFVALTQALEERRYDLAIMRTLGAPRGKIVAVLLLESVLLAALGLVVGLAVAHGLTANVGAWLPAAAPLEAGAWTWRPAEWGVVALALGAGIIATLIPAWRAYRLDVAGTLAEG